MWPPGRRHSREESPCPDTPEEIPEADLWAADDRRSDEIRRQQIRAGRLLQGVPLPAKVDLPDTPLD